jgi:protein-disulfide isomerase
MSRKSQRNSPKPADPKPDEKVVLGASLRHKGFLAAFGVALLILLAAGVLVYKNEQKGQLSPGAEAAALASSHSPTLGSASAPVHVVEFLDPACETCALFFPIVKELMARNPGKIRLSVRHVALHDGSEYPVRVLEASRMQDKYWQTLEALLGSQSAWAPNHSVRPELVLQALSGVGLDTERLMADMNSPEVAQRMQQDLSDAAALKVTATPEYFVNGRPLPSFGEDQLVGLIGEELRRAQ